MVLDAKIARLREHFGIQQPEDWQGVMPEWVLAVPEVGPQTLNHLRLHLAARGLTLRNDQTPAFWQQHLSSDKLGTSHLDGTDAAVVCPFTVLVDSQEKNPFTFAGIRADARQQNRPMIVPTEWRSLGPTHGDYSIAGMEHEVHIERKSREDCQGTLLGWGERRERFERTLKFLAEIPSSLVIVECTEGELYRTAPSRGKKSARENAKILMRSIGAYQDDFRVPWRFADTRRLAEIVTFRWLERYHRHRAREAKRAQTDGSAELDAVL